MIKPTQQNKALGAVFNNELLNVFVERRWERNATPDREPDDMGPYDTSFANVLVSGMTREFHPSTMQLLLLHMIVVQTTINPCF